MGKSIVESLGLTCIFSNGQPKDANALTQSALRGCRPDRFVLLSFYSRSKSQWYEFLDLLIAIMCNGHS